MCVLCVTAELEEVVEFFEEVIASLLADQEVRTFGEVMVPVFDIFQGRVKDLDLCQLLLSSYLEILLYFSRQKDIAKVRIVALMSSNSDVNSKTVNVIKGIVTPKIKHCHPLLTLRFEAISICCSAEHKKYNWNNVCNQTVLGHY